MQVKGVDFVVYHVSDYQKSLAFYRDTLGLKLTEEYGGYWAEFDAGNVTLAISSHDFISVEKRTGATAALAVAEVKEAVEELRGKGVKIVSEPEETGVCTIAAVNDPDNNTIILHQRKDGTAG